MSIPISGLPAGTTPTGTEEVPVVQSLETVKLTTAQIAALALLRTAEEIANNVTPTDYAYPPLVAARYGSSAQIAVTLTAGQNDNLAPAGLKLYSAYIDCTLSAASSISGVTAGIDGLQIIITNVSAFTLTLLALSADSAGTNQFRLPDDIDLAQYQSATFIYSTGAGLWLAS